MHKYKKRAMLSATLWEIPIEENVFEGKRHCNYKIFHAIFLLIGEIEIGWYI